MMDLNPDEYLTKTAKEFTEKVKQTMDDYIKLSTGLLERRFFKGLYCTNPKSMKQALRVMLLMQSNIEYWLEKEIGKIVGEEINYCDSYLDEYDSFGFMFDIGRKLTKEEVDDIKELGFNHYYVENSCSYKVTFETGELELIEY